MKNIRNKYLKKFVRLGFTMSVLSLSLSACEGFLDKEPYDIVKENYYKNAEEVKSGLIGIYDIIGKEQLYGGLYSSFVTLGDEGAYFRSTYTTGIEVYNYDASNPTVALMWEYLYKGIERANFFLSKVPEVVMDETEKNAAIGEAKFLRAYYYFLLVSNWGDVPLKTTATNSVTQVEIPKTAQKDVYDFIVKEMEESDGMVKDIQAYGHAGRVTKSAVRGILARVYLKMAGYPLQDATKYAKALEWSEKLVFPSGNQYVHKLSGDYTKIFKDMAADKYNIDESIWEVELYGNRLGDFEAGRIGNYGGIQNNLDETGFSYGFIAATRKLYQLYEAVDTRRNWNIADHYYTGNVSTGAKVFYTAAQIDQRHMAKYRRDYEVALPRNRNYTPINFPLLRYSDVLLMFAEAENEVNGSTERAREKMKEVRSRALAKDISLAIMSKESLRDSIKNERMRELCYEGLRRFDMVRYGNFVKDMNDVGTVYKNNVASSHSYLGLGFNNVTTRDVYLPIPINEISLNKAIVQNTGW